MSQAKLSNIIDCKNLSSDEINSEVRRLILNKQKVMVLKGTKGKSGLLDGINGEIKIELLESVGSYFANGINGPKITVNGDVGDYSASDIKSGKLIIFGSCGRNFGCNLSNAEIYVLQNCGKNSFCALSDFAKVVIGRQIASGLVSVCGGRIVILNLSGGSLFLDNEWLNNYKSGFVYVRGEKREIKYTDSLFLIEETNYVDEDIYLPLISEYARLFNFSLSKIKSKMFYKVVLGK